MSLEFIGRLQKELSLTGSAVYESVIAIAERVNRKVHILRLHAQASSLLTQIETAHGELGRRIATTLPLTASDSSQELGRWLEQTTELIHRMKQQLVKVDGQIRDLKMEAVHADLLALQRDLSLRAAALERFCAVHGAPATGKQISELTLPGSVRIVTIFRGPFLLAPSDDIILRADDIIILVGLRADLDAVMPWFVPVRGKKSA